MSSDAVGRSELRDDAYLREAIKGVLNRRRDCWDTALYRAIQAALAEHPVEPPRESVTLRTTLEQEPDGALKHSTRPLAAQPCGDGARDFVAELADELDRDSFDMHWDGNVQNTGNNILD
jgi:hypothetical protein